VLARTVLGQLNRTLSYRAHQVMYESLVRLGYLALGDDVSLRATPHARAYDVVEPDMIFRRVR
jgi:chemotaxis protein methyltransferase CheR